jgi:hypothetical protein
MVHGNTKNTKHAKNATTEQTGLEDRLTSSRRRPPFVPFVPFVPFASFVFP